MLLNKCFCQPKWCVISWPHRWFVFELMGIVHSVFSKWSDFYIGDDSLKTTGCFCRDWRFLWGSPGSCCPAWALWLQLKRQHQQGIPSLPKIAQGAPRVEQSWCAWFEVLLFEGRWCGFTSLFLTLCLFAGCAKFKAWTFPFHPVHEPL